MITIFKILKVKTDPNHSDGKQVATFVLTDGSIKKLNILGGLPDNNQQAKDSILLRGQELFNSGRIWSDDDGNIDGIKKDLKKVKQDLIASTDFATLKPVLLDLLKVIKDIADA